jgi:hypothetical protein
MLRPCISASSPISSSRTSSWTNCVPDCAVLTTCSGWPSTPSRSLFPSSIWAPARKTPRIPSSTPCDNSWPPFCLPLFTSDGLNVYFYALTAHFGDWFVGNRRGRNVQKTAGGSGPELWSGEEKLPAMPGWFGSPTSCAWRQRMRSSPPYRD